MPLGQTVWLIPRRKVVPHKKVRGKKKKENAEAYEYRERSKADQRGTGDHGTKSGVTESDGYEKNHNGEGQKYETRRMEKGKVWVHCWPLLVWVAPAERNALGPSFLRHGLRISYPLAARHYESQYRRNIGPLRAESTSADSLGTK
ncbi:hypothetical protein KM043_011892 [Ampulex compressa]|nr:hypothetical protein KM043_011892 [Ampulex compressa]